MSYVVRSGLCRLVEWAKGAGLVWLFRWLVDGGRWSVVGGGLDSQVVAIKAEQAIICSSNPGTF